MKQLIRRHSIIVAISLLLFIAAVIGLVWFSASIRSKEHRVLEARDRLASYEQNKRQFAEESAKLANIREHAAALEEHVITEETAPATLSAIEAMAQREGLAITLTSVVATSTTAKAPAKLHIDFSAEGSFSGIDRFVDTLLSQAYQVRVTRLSLYQAENKKGGWQLLAGIDIMSF